ncbi:DNA processing protein [Pseudobutyrivibrio sp. ACV-2]|uniref:DNA-processing protein DprA n=1 Tax=Pseudobutyrivibrio sp. ACV-2 TaxID=1520801 RepID=UPI0008987188|nr:DNA-processing protein DprA [Pseudobutyrivibrio sp. ACV-2]SEB07757.1 DNA processing protein [Pseudobutyrivibrio sp. ACV-2]
MDEIVYWIWLTTIPYVGIKSQHILLMQFDNPRKVYEASMEGLSKTGIGTKRCTSIMNSKSLDSAIRIIEDCKKKGISIITCRDVFYTDKYIRDDNLPILLYCKGDIENVVCSSYSIGVIGARRCTQKDKAECIKFISEISIMDNPTIISGAAKGIDGYAHTAAIKNGLKTIAFVGNGLDIYYPKEHTGLIDEISQNGVVISQFPPGTPPLRYHFPMRNRLIAAWSDELKVFGAGRNSGTGYTVEYFRMKSDYKFETQRNVL